MRQFQEKLLQDTNQMILIWEMLPNIVMTPQCSVGGWVSRATGL